MDSMQKLKRKEEHVGFDPELQRRREEEVRRRREEEMQRRREAMTQRRREAKLCLRPLQRVLRDGDEEIIVPAYIERPDGSFVPIEAAELGDFNVAFALEWYKKTEAARCAAAREEHERRAEAFACVGSLIRRGVKLLPAEDDAHRDGPRSREPVSPELMLVDPELAERARHGGGLPAGRGVASLVRVDV